MHRHSPPRLRRLPVRLPIAALATALVGAGAGLAVVLPATAAYAAAPTTAHVNFQPSGITPPQGYTADVGKPFDGTSGWRDSTGTPQDFTGNMRIRRSSASLDLRTDTLALMQADKYSSSGNTATGYWTTTLANGTYDVTVGVGDATATNSVDTIVAQPGTGDAVTVVNAFQPTSTKLFTTGTKQVRVSNGTLTLAPVGGTNTKLDYVDVTPTASGDPRLSVTSADTAKLALPTPRLVFSTIQTRATAARSFTFSNSGAGPLTISGLHITGTQASSFALASGQPTSLTIAAGGSATVSVVFTPTAPTNCPTSSSTWPIPIGDSVRAATLTWTSNETAPAVTSAALGGIASCSTGGNNEPVMDQILSALGYGTVVGGSDRRFLGPSRYLSGGDEVISPYFTAADPTSPVTLTPIAHYGGFTTTAGGYAATGWFAKGNTMPTSCSSTCNVLFKFAPDTFDGPGGYTANQMLLPPPTGTTTFSTTGAFGLFNGGSGEDSLYSDDTFDVAITGGANGTSYTTPISPRHDLHVLRVWPAYTASRQLIPNTYLVGVDLTKVPSFKNNDFQDVVLLLRNAKPAVSTAAAPGTTVTDLTTGGTVSGSCAVTGFSGVLANSAGTQCSAGNIAFTSSGLKLTSTAGQLANHDQQNALYRSFDASKGAFTVTARVAGPVNQLTKDYQQIGAWFGPDQNNFVKVEAEHNGEATPHLTMFWSENGSAGTVGSVAVPGLTSASTLDLVIKGNTTVPDPIASTSDTYKVHGYPLDQVTVYYSLNGGPLVQVGGVKSPADVTSWFSTNAKAGILVSNTGSTTSFSTTFTRFGITKG